MGVISNWRWRRECRNAFRRAVETVKSSPLGGLGEMSDMIVMSMLREVKDKLYDREVLWHHKSEKVLEEEAQKAIRKYVLKEKSFSEKVSSTIESIFDVLYRISTWLLVIAIAVVFIIIFYDMIATIIKCIVSLF